MARKAKQDAGSKEPAAPKGARCEVTYRNGRREILRGSVEDVTARLQQDGRAFQSVTEQ